MSKDRVIPPMKYYRRPYTEKFPFQYTVESARYVVHTCNLADYNRLLCQIVSKGITEFTPIQITKLECSSFTTIRKG